MISYYCTCRLLQAACDVFVHIFDHLVSPNLWKDITASESMCVPTCTAENGTRLSSHVWWLCSTRVQIGQPRPVFEYSLILCARGCIPLLARLNMPPRTLPPRALPPRALSPRTLWLVLKLLLSSARLNIPGLSPIFHLGVVLSLPQVGKHTLSLSVALSWQWDST